MRLINEASNAFSEPFCSSELRASSETGRCHLPLPYCSRDFAILPLVS